MEQAQAIRPGTLIHPSFRLHSGKILSTGQCRRPGQQRAVHSWGHLQPLCPEGGQPGRTPATSSANVLLVREPSRATQRTSAGRECRWRELRGFAATVRSSAAAGRSRGRAGGPPAPGPMGAAFLSFNSSTEKLFPRRLKYSSKSPELDFG